MFRFSSNTLNLRKYLSISVMTKYMFVMHMESTSFEHNYFSSCCIIKQLVDPLERDICCIRQALIQPQLDFISPDQMKSSCGWMKACLIQHMFCSRESTNYLFLHYFHKKQKCAQIIRNEIKRRKTFKCWCRWCKCFVVLLSIKSGTTVMNYLLCPGESYSLAPDSPTYSQNLQSSLQVEQ